MSVAAIVVVAGGALAAGGSLLTWASATAGGFSVSARGLDGWEGKLTLAGGAIMLIAGVAALAGSGSSRLRGSAVIGGLVVAGVGIYTAATAKDQVVDGAAAEIARQLDVPLAQARDAIRTTIDTGLLSIGLEVGLYLVIVGGVLGAAAAVLAWASSRREPGASTLGRGIDTGWTMPAPAAPVGAPDPTDPDPTGTPAPIAPPGSNPWATPGTRERPPGTPTPPPPPSPGPMTPTHPEPDPPGSVPER
ncbi:MAG: hypothetical protein ACE14W_10585 [Candidatus Velamenicoccus archaeovorus]